MAKVNDRGAGEGEVAFGPADCYRSFLEAIDFPRRTVTVRPEHPPSPEFRRLSRPAEVARAMLACFAEGKTGRVIISVDERARLE